MYKIIILGILLLLPTVTALKQCTTNYCNDFVIGKPAIQSNSTLYINDMVINIGATTEKKAHLYKIVSGAIVPISGGGGGVVGSIITQHYDLLVHLNKKKYKTDENIIANITIINKGNVVDSDGYLISYLLSPNGTIYRQEELRLDLIPPTCEYGTYNWYEDVCLEGNQEYTPNKIIVSRKIAVPKDAKMGEWKFIAEYQTKTQPLVKVYNTFKILFPDYSIIIIIIVAILAFHFGKKSKRNKIPIKKGIMRE